MTIYITNHQDQFQVFLFDGTLVSKLAAFPTLISANAYAAYYARTNSISYEEVI